MSKMKKVVLFLVEGITDKVALEHVLPNLLENDKVVFKIIDGDLTARYGITQKNILSEVGQIIKKYLANNRYQKSDILKIVHLTDTDGAFIPENAVNFYETPYVQYFPECIKTKNVESIKIRNSIKAGALVKLSETCKILGIHYSIYFFSCNQEHVLHNIQDSLSDNEKMQLAEKFSEQYGTQPQKFIEFISSEPLAVPGDYRDTWLFIRQGCNSLNRFCNLHIFFQAGA